MRITDAGRVCIGTTANGIFNNSRLNVHYDADADGTGIEVGNSSAAGSDNETAYIHLTAMTGGKGVFMEATREGDYSSAANSSSTFNLYCNEANSLVNRLRITEFGSNLTYTKSGYNSIRVHNGSSSGTSQYLYLGYYGSTNVIDGTAVYGVFTDGSVDGAANSYGGWSDVKLKENIVDANSQWNDIKNLRVRNFNLKEGVTKKQIGLIAQEAETVSPGLVFETPDRDEDGKDLGTTTKSLRYSVLYMKAIKALQEAMAKIETLETKVAALEAK